MTAGLEVSKYCSLSEAKRNSCSTRLRSLRAALRSLISSTTPIQYLNFPDGSRTTEAVRLVQIGSPFLRIKHFSMENTSISPFPAKQA